jgi:transposase
VHQIREHVDPYYTEVTGYELIVDDHVQAVIKKKGQKVDLVFQMRGPLDIELARPIVVGLLDLLVHYDRMVALKGKKLSSDGVE